MLPLIVRPMGPCRSLRCPVYALIIGDVFNPERTTTVIRALPPTNRSSRCKGMQMAPQERGSWKQDMVMAVRVGCMC